MPPERLSKFDAIFYYTSNRRVAMQITIAIFIDGPVDFDRYLAWVSPRIDRVPHLKMRIKPSPFAMRLPAWVDAQNFDPREHFIPQTLEPPGDEQSLRALIEVLIRERLSIDKSLWRVYVINGLEDGRAVFLLCMHHCLADAEATFQIFNVLLDAQTFEQQSSTRVSKAGLMRQAYASHPLHSLRSLLSRDGRRRLAILTGYALTRGARLPFTRPVSGRVRIAWRVVSLHDLTAVGKVFDATVTDVVLALLGAAVDAYAHKHRVEANGKRLLLQVPANVRLPDKYGLLGNELTMLPAVVPLGLRDSVERLRRVAEYNHALKDLDMAVVIHGLMGTLFSALTPPGEALFCKVMVSKPHLHLARLTGLPPQDHAHLSSIVAPSLDYKADGQRVTGFANFVVCQFNMGFAFSPVTYGDRVTFALAVDAENFGEAVPFMDDIIAALEELRAESAKQTPASAAT